MTCKNKLSYLALLTVVFLIAIVFYARQGSRAHRSLPILMFSCQEMPMLIENFGTDTRAVARFYNTSFYGSRNGGYGEHRNARQAARRKKESASTNCITNTLAGSNGSISTAFPRNVRWTIFSLKGTWMQEGSPVGRRGVPYTTRSKAGSPSPTRIYGAEKLRRRGHPLDAQQLAKTWSDGAAQIVTLRGHLKTDSSLDMPSLYEAGLIIGDLKRAIDNINDFYTGYDPQYTWWMPKAYKELDDALGAYAVAYKEKNSRFAGPDKSGITGQPAGREQLLRELKYEMIPYSPEELIDIANKEFAWCDKEMLKASHEMGFGDDWKAALEKVKNTTVPPGQQPEMILGLYNESVAFLKKHDLVTIPPLAEETWGMMMMSPERQLQSPFFLGGDQIIISYPTNTMDEDDRLMSMRGNNPHLSRATVHHELIARVTTPPGLYEQPATVTYQCDFGSGFWTEGWSLVLGTCLLWGSEISSNAGRQDRDAVLAYAPLRPHHLLAQLSPRQMDARTMYRFSGGPGRTRTGQCGRGSQEIL